MSASSPKAAQIEDEIVDIDSKNIIHQKTNENNESNENTQADQNEVANILHLIFRSYEFQ